MQRLVFKLISRSDWMFVYHGMEPEDLRQESYFAVIQAVRAYDSQNGLRFTSYLEYPVRNVARETLGLRGCASRPMQVQSLDDESLPGSEGATLADSIEDPDAVAALDQALEELQRAQLRAVLDECLEVIPQEYAAAVRARYCDNGTLQNIGDEMGISREHVRRLEAKGLQQLRRPQPRQKLHPFLEVHTYSQEYKGVGLQTFRRRQASAVEWAHEQMEQRWVP